MNASFKPSRVVAALGAASLFVAQQTSAAPINPPAPTITRVDDSWMVCNFMPSDAAYRQSPAITMPAPAPVNADSKSNALDAGQNKTPIQRVDIDRCWEMDGLVHHTITLPGLPDTTIAMNTRSRFPQRNF